MHIAQLESICRGTGLETKRLEQCLWFFQKSLTVKQQYTTPVLVHNNLTMGTFSFGLLRCSFWRRDIILLCIVVDII